jgi:hypothetical protein
MATQPLSSDQYFAIFSTKCIDIFSKLPYNWQIWIGATMLHSINISDVAIHQLCARPTGGGKSLLFSTLAACIGKITLCIAPLLSLKADQTIKHLQQTTTSSQSINNIHLDEVPSADMDAIISCCNIHAH